ncbi:hypothetical protein O5D80_003253 [Batrachochytrium dendrobatidis]|nr:hypothetical protein O5D80_003253 [Batrachochytrium dendrobatidis]
MPKRFLNVEYDTLTAEIDVTDFEDLSDIQDAIKSDFLREKVIDNGILGWILGPPGTGKSTTALAFASTLDKNDWVVTWIHLYIDCYPVCVRLEGDSKKSQEIYDSNIDKLFDILHKVDESKQHIVFIDGYTSNGQKHIDVQQACYSWLEEDREKRRLEEEYIHAVQNDEFFNHVKAVLDSDLQIDSSREDLVRSKLYFAGASARCMFLFATKDVIQQTYGSITFVNDIFPYVKGTIGDQSNNVVDRLFSSSLVENDVFPRKTSIVSQFAGVMLAIKKGPDLIRKLANATRHDGNPSMDGWMLEMWFFASLHYDGVKLFDENDNEVQTWPASNFKTLDINAFPALPENNGVWFKPNKWNQGGFDAIFLDKGKGLVRFVQVTDGNTHSFKIEYFHSFLLMLCQSPQSFEITCLEIIFVADQKERSTFKVAEPSVPGMLTDFGWRLGEELDKVKVVFIKGWCD